MKKLLFASFLLLSTLEASTINLNGANSVSGAPGSVVGWDYSITNTTSNFLVVNGATASGFDPLTGTFLDFISSINFTVVGPNSTFGQPFSHGGQTGFGEFAILNMATVGNVTGATFLVTYDLLVNDPNGPLGGNPGDEFGLSFASFEGTVTVTGAGGTATPEPSTSVMSGFGLLLAGWGVFRSRQVGSA